MKTTSSPTHSLEVKSTPKHIIPRRSKSLEPINSHSKRFSAVTQNVEQNLLTPIRTPKSFLSDTTNIVEPRRKSWWKRLGENTIQDLSFLHEYPIKEMDDVLGDYEQGNQNGQKNNNYDLDLPESSSNETIESIVIPQRKLFNQKEITLQNKFENVVEKENSMSKQLESKSKAQEIQHEAPTTKPQKNAPIFPAALLNISSNVTNKTQELPNLEQKKKPKNLFSNRPTNKNNVFTNIKLIESEDESLHLESKAKAKNLFGNRMTNVRNNRFSGLIATESEDDIPNIQPKIFEFQKPGKRRKSSMTQGDASLSLNVTSDTEFNNWKMLPSSTMVEDNISEKNTPAKKLRLTRTSYVNNEYCESSHAKASPSITKVSPKTNNHRNINEDVYDVNNQVANHEHQTHLTDNYETNTALSNNDSIQLKKNNSTKPTDELVNKISNESNKHISETIHINNCSSQNKNSVMISKNNQSKREEQEDFNHMINQEKVDVNDDISALITKECINDNKNCELESKNENEQSKNHNCITNTTKINLIIEKEIQSHSIDSENLQCDKEIVESLQVNKDISILEKERVIIKSNENLYKTNQQSLGNVLDNVDSITKLHTEHIEIKENDYNENKSVSQNEEQRIPEEEVYTENETISEVKSVLRDEISEKEQSSQETEIDEECRTLVENIENSSMECNIDSPAHINSNEDDSKIVDIKEHSCNRNYIKNDISNKSNHNESLTQRENNHNVIVEQTLEDISPISKHDINEVSKLDTSKIRSPEAILNVTPPNYLCKTLPNRSSLRNTNFIERATLRPSFFSMKDSLDLQCDGSKHSSSEGSGWDSHRTTRKTLRQTFGKDFTFRKSLRTLVMEKSAKGNANIECNIKPDFQNTIDQINDKSFEKFIEDEARPSQGKDVNVSISEKFSEPVEFIEGSESAKTNEYSNKNEAPIKSTDNQFNIITCTNESISQQVNKINYLKRNTPQDNNLGNVDQSVEQISDVVNTNKVINENIVPEKDEVAAENKSASEIEHYLIDKNKITEENVSAVQNVYDNEIETENAKENVSVCENNSTGVNYPIETESADEENGTKETDSLVEYESMDDNQSSEQNESICENEYNAENKSINDDETHVRLVMEDISDDEEKECENEIEMTEENELTTDESAVENDHSEENEISNENDFVNEENETINERLFTAQNNTKTNGNKRKQVQTSLKQYMEKIKENHIEKYSLMREKVMNELKVPIRESRSIDLYRPMPVKKIKSFKEPPKKTTRIKTTPFGIPPKELLEDLNYKPQKPFKPRNAPWINKRLYKFLESKLEPKYDYHAQHRSEKFATYLYKFTQEYKKDKVYPNEAIKYLKQEMARLNIVETHFDFYIFCREYLPKEIRIKIIPDILNKLPLPKRGVHTNILINQQ